MRSRKSRKGTAVGIQIAEFVSDATGSLGVFGRGIRGRFRMGMASFALGVIEDVTGLSFVTSLGAVGARNERGRGDVVERA